MYHEVIILGVIVSILIREITGLSPAGLIVPGYIVLCLKTPGRVLYTIVIALSAYLLVRLLGSIVILYGRRRFAVIILTAFIIDAAIISSGFLTPLPGLIGVLIPGIIAREFDYQGVTRSLLALSVSVGIISLLLLAAGISVFRI